MTLTREEAIANHRKMWNWIADETKRRKRVVRKCEYFVVFGIKDVPKNHCYCCEYSYINDVNSCASCPVEWPNDGLCFNAHGLYNAWFVEAQISKWTTGRWRHAAKLARQIAQLSERGI